MITDFNVKRKAVWDKIGVDYSEFLNQSEYLKAAGLDFDVIKAPLYAKTFDIIDDKRVGLLSEKPETQWKNMPKSYALLRSDNGYMFTDNGKAVTESYSVFQNSEMFSFLDKVCDMGNILYDKAGQFDFGKRVFTTIDLNDNIEIFGDDVIQRYLLITSRHDGRGAIHIRFINQRIVCENTLELALREQTKHTWSVRHTPNKDERLDTVKEIIGDLKIQKKQVEEKLMYYKQVELNSKQQLALLALSYFDNRVYTNLKNNRFVLTEEVIDKNGANKTKTNNILKEFNALRVTLEQGVGQQIHQGTLLNVYNGITCYIQNVKEYTSNEVHFDNIFNNDIINKFETNLLSNLQEISTL